MLHKIYKIRESIDIYTLPLSNGLYRIQFYRINTRDKKTIESEKIVLDILLLLNGINTILNISEKLQIDIDSIKTFINYLHKNGFIVEINKDKNTDERFLRQISFFDDLIPNKLGFDTQKKLSSKTIVIFGVGAVGGDIAILLVRAGIKKIVLIDYKKLDESHKVRHLYCNNLNIGQYKTEALKEYLQKINKNIIVNCINEPLKPSTNLDDFIPPNTDLVINCADEPYIGHTSTKIGRYLWSRNIAMYVAGGFDAHSMSTGEFIIPNKTACIDCHINSFTKALKDWKPTYNAYKNQNIKKDINNNMDIIIGGAGSIAQCSLFSASYATMSIIFYLIEKFDMLHSRRGEYLINQGIFSWVDFTKEHCEICKR